ncbi:MAG TPA: hypothetical protein VFN31_02890 [Candidatus Saccharimonadales bacterium]|nr:hypothetical protein [Candidatus Saccharimonadales bacterium]
MNAKLLRKVPQVTLLFWVIKLLTTAMGESTSDFLVFQFNPYAAVILGFVVFVGVLFLQFRTKRYIPLVYWLAVLMVAIFGTMAADVMHVVIGIPYLVTTIAFAILLGIVFYLWKTTEGTLSIHSITTTRRELFYWATVLTTFALGTAAGDLFAYTFKLGFLSAGIIFAGLFIVPALGFFLLKWNPIFSFWFAYIMTRPLGASFADWTGKAHSLGALGWGDGPVAGVLFLLIIICVVYLQITHEDVDKSPAISSSTR